MSTDTENQTLAEYAQQAAAPAPVEPGSLIVIADGDGSVKVVDTDEYAAHPRRAKSTRTVNDAASFVAYLAKHGLANSEVWADTVNSTVVGVIDAHTDASEATVASPQAGWESHKVNLKLEKSKPWLAWEQSDGVMMAQLDFAEFIDLRAIDVRTPAPAELIELAQHFQAKRNLDYESSERMSDGQTQLTYKETTTAKAGTKGHIEIPDTLQLVLKPYIGGPAYFVTARFRYRLVGAVLQLGYVLERPQEILDAAFADIVALIRDGKEDTPDREATATSPAVAGSPGFPGVTQPIYYGRP